MTIRRRSTRLDISRQAADVGVPSDAGGPPLKKMRLVEEAIPTEPMIGSCTIRTSVSSDTLSETDLDRSVEADEILVQNIEAVARQPPFFVAPSATIPRPTGVQKTIPVEVAVIKRRAEGISVSEAVAATESEAFIESSTELPLATSKRRRENWLFFIASYILGMFVLSLVAITTLVDVDPRSVYVPGAGFSGFWYTLGKIYHMDEPQTKQFHCYSAGCLAVTALMADRNVHDLLESAGRIQEEWLSGDLCRYEIVNRFVNDILPMNQTNFCDAESEMKHLLNNMHIITSHSGPWGLLRSVSRTPTSCEELREMLLQTTWIPGVVGKSLMRDDHMDGAFTTWWPGHTRCAQHISLEPDWDLLMNTLNVKLSVPRALEFYQMNFV